MFSACPASEAASCTALPISCNAVSKKAQHTGRPEVLPGHGSPNCNSWDTQAFVQYHDRSSPIATKPKQLTKQSKQQHTPTEPHREMIPSIHVTVHSKGHISHRKVVPAPALAARAGLRATVPAFFVTAPEVPHVCSPTPRPLVALTAPPLATAAVLALLPPLVPPSRPLPRPPPGSWVRSIGWNPSRGTGSCRHMTDMHKHVRIFLSAQCQEQACLASMQPSNPTGVSNDWAATNGIHTYCAVHIHIAAHVPTWSSGVP